jgi:acyl-CoA thioesterase YciA
MSDKDTPKGPPDYQPALRAIPMPADANQSGDIFGGWVLAQMDLAGGSIAARRVKGRCATVAITAMSFHEPIFVGDEVSCYGEIVRVGRTSLTVKIESWARRWGKKDAIKVTEGLFTFVALGPDRQPRPVPPEE